MDFLIANFFELKEKVLFNKMGKGHHLYGGGFGSSRVQAMYFCLPFEAINANKKTNDIFKHFQN
jgi:hypothetical protein